MDNFKYKVLFLTSAYPSRINPVAGIFVKKHAKAVSKYCNVSVLYVISDPELKTGIYEIEHNKEDNILEVKVYYKKFRSKFPIISKLFNVLRYIKGNYMGYKYITKEFGKPDIIQVNFAYPIGIFGLIIKYLSGIPYVITEHWSGYTTYSGVFDKFSIAKKFLIKLIFKNSIAVIAVSDFLLNCLKERKLVKNLSFIIPNVIDLYRDLDDKKENKSKIKIFTNSLLVDKVKNVSGLIKAFATLSNKFPNIELHIIGDGVDRNMLEGLAHDLGLLNEKVFFHGYIPNDKIYSYLSEADIFVLNSNFETFSVATAEALSCGIPVVVTKCGGPEEFVNNEVGVLVERQNEESLMNGLEYVIKNLKKYDKRKIQEYFKNKFSYEIVGKEFCKVYDIILKKDTDL